MRVQTSQIFCRKSVRPVNIMAKKNNFAECLAVEVASGSRIREAAGVAGCSISHAYHLSIDSSFQSRVSELRSQATAQAVGKLSSAAIRAVDTLVVLLDSAEPRDRLAAAKAILATLVPLSEFGELRQRIDAMERKQFRVTA